MLTAVAPRRSRPSQHRARRRDRRVYLVSHPIIFALLCATRGRPVTRLGGTVLVQGTGAFRQALTELSLDRTAEHTVGGLARNLVGDGVLFDQDGSAHRELRRSLADALSASGVQRLRPAWRGVIGRYVAALGAGDEADLARLAAEVAGVTVTALLRVDADPLELTRAARLVAATAVHDQLPGLPRRGGAAPAGRSLADVTADLIQLLERSRPGIGGVGAMLAVAAVNTTVAGLPRAVAWCADAGLWPDAGSDHSRDLLVSELLRVTAPTALLYRVAAAPGALTGPEGVRRIRQHDRLVLVARHAAGAHASDPDCGRPAAPRVAQLVFGAGTHACPGAALARAQLADSLALLAPYRPVVVRAQADRHSALPGWKSLVIRAGAHAEP